MEDELMELVSRGKNRQEEHGRLMLEGYSAPRGVNVGFASEQIDRALWILADGIREGREFSLRYNEFRVIKGES